MNSHVMECGMPGNPGVYVRFWMKNQPDPKASAAQGMHVTKEVDMVTFLKPRAHGQPDETPVPWGGVPGAEKAALLPLYERWKAGRAAPLNGVPLEEWPLMNPDFIEPLARLQIRTLEDFAAAAEALVRTVPGAITMQEKAKAHLAAAANIGATSERLREMEQKFDWAMKQVEMLSAQVAKDHPPEPSPAPAPEKADTADSEILEVDGVRYSKGKIAAGRASK